MALALYWKYSIIPTLGQWILKLCDCIAFYNVAARLPTGDHGDHLYLYTKWSPLIE